MHDKLTVALVVDDPDNRLPFGVELDQRVVAALDVPAATRRPMVQESGFNLDHHETDIGSKHEEVALPSLVSVVLVVESPPDDPVVREAAEVVGHPQFGRIREFGWSIEDSVGQGFRECDPAPGTYEGLSTGVG